METQQEINQLEQNLNSLNYKPAVSPLKGWRTRSGEVISWGEFFKRWKQGMQNLSPSQRISNDIASSFIILIGFIVSIAALIFFNKTFGVVTYGLIIIFIGNVYSNVVKLFGLFGQYNIYKNIEGMTK
jgi:hypothetical protein